MAGTTLHGVLDLKPQRVSSPDLDVIRFSANLRSGAHARRVKPLAGLQIQTSAPLVKHYAEGRW